VCGPFFASKRWETGKGGCETLTGTRKQATAGPEFTYFRDRSPACIPQKTGLGPSLQGGESEVTGESVVRCFSRTFDRSRFFFKFVRTLTCRVERCAAANIDVEYLKQRPNVISSRQADAKLELGRCEDCVDDCERLSL
jgi:hypothetical protein